MQHLHLFSRTNKTNLEVFVQIDKVKTKIWGIMVIDYYGFIVVWGVNGSPLASRRMPGFAVNNIIEKKIKTGYVAVDMDTEIYNNVNNQFQQHLVWETLMGRPTDHGEKLMSNCAG